MIEDKIKQYYYTEGSGAGGGNRNYNSSGVEIHIKGELNTLFQITSTAPGTQCDFFPFGSLHANKTKIPAFCEVFEVTTETKVCPGFCGSTYPASHPFVDANQNGDDPMCVRCYSKKYVVGRSAYYKAVRAELMIELNHSK